MHRECALFVRHHAAYHEMRSRSIRPHLCCDMCNSLALLGKEPACWLQWHKHTQNGQFQATHIIVLNMEQSSLLQLEGAGSRAPLGNLGPHESQK